MEEILVDFTGVTSIDGLHEVLKKSLRFYDDYGMNLDALWDYMYDYCEDMHVTIIGLDTLPKDYYFQEEVAGILKIFKRATEKMDSFAYTLVNGKQNGG